MSQPIEIVGADYDIEGDDEFGDDDGFGADPDAIYQSLVSGDDDVSGGRRRRRRPQPRPRARVIPMNMRRYPMPFPATAITANGTADVIVQPQLIVRIDKMVIPSNIAFDLVLTDIKIGQASQLINAGQIPAAAFSEVAEETLLELATAQVGNTVTFSFLEIGGTAKTIRGMALGFAMQR